MNGTPPNEAAEATVQPETTTDEDAAFLAICRGEQQPDPTSYRAGWDDHEAGKAFHEGPRPFHTVKGLSWRLGWNERALAQ